MYTVTQDNDPAALKPWLVVLKSNVVARFAEKRFAAKKARQLNFRRGFKDAATED